MSWVNSAGCLVSWSLISSLWLSRLLSDQFFPPLSSPCYQCAQGCLTQRCLLRGGQWVLECCWPALRFVFLSRMQMQISWEDNLTWRVGRTFSWLLLWRLNEIIYIKVLTRHSLWCSQRGWTIRWERESVSRGHGTLSVISGALRAVLLLWIPGAFAFVGPFSVKNIKNYITTLLYKEDYNPNWICNYMFNTILFNFSSGLKMLKLIFK